MEELLTLYYIQNRKIYKSNIYQKYQEFYIFYKDWEQKNRDEFSGKFIKIVDISWDFEEVKAKNKKRIQKAIFKCGIKIQKLNALLEKNDQINLK
jgi:hypothetical protein